MTGDVPMQTAAELDRDLIRRYLLEQLSEQESDRLELHLLANGTVSEGVAAVGDELIDDYAAGRLERDERIAFERRLRGSAHLRERVAFARALARATGEASAQAGGEAPDASAGRAPDNVAPFRERAATPRWSRMAAAATVVLGLGCGWLLWRSETLRQEVLSLQTDQRAAATRIEGLDAEREALAERNTRLEGDLTAERTAAEIARQQAEELAAALAERPETSTAAAPPEPSVVSFVLSPALRSDLGARRFRVPEADERVRLTLDLGVDEGFGSYLAVVNGPSGVELWSRGGLTAAESRSRVEVELPAGLLGAGRHEVLLYGESDGGDPELIGAFELDLTRA